MCVCVLGLVVVFGIRSVLVDYFCYLFLEGGKIFYILNI